MSPHLASENDSQQSHALADIEEVAAQLEAGDLDPSTAEQLIARYRDELKAAETMGSEPQAPVLPRRRMVGMLLMIAAFGAVSLLALVAIQPRDGGPVTGNIESATNADAGLDTVTNDQMEAVIAANPELPEVAAMQVALADRYFDETAFSDALPHYLDALGGRLDPTRRARALARIGWMSFISGRSDLAQDYLAQALQTDPGYQESHLFVGLMRFSAGDAAGALAELEPLLAGDDLPDDLRHDLQEAVDSARAELVEQAP